MTVGKNIVDGFCENLQQSFTQKQGLIKKVKGGNQIV